MSRFIEQRQKMIAAALSNRQPSLLSPKPQMEHPREKGVPSADPSSSWQALQPYGLRVPATRPVLSLRRAPTSWPPGSFKAPRSQPAATPPPPTTPTRLPVGIQLTWDDPLTLPGDILVGSTESLQPLTDLVYTEFVAQGYPGRAIREELRGRRPVAALHHRPLRYRQCSPCAAPRRAGELPPPGA
jgi:hypothetical protein